jgi:hypothetical protein
MKEIFIAVTKIWWTQEGRHFDLWISDEVLDEVGKGNYPNQRQVIECALQLPILPFDAQIQPIAQTYIDNYLMPRTLAGDALHLAYASFYQMDFLLTWNCNHLANANKQQHIRNINTRLNLAVPLIVTPLQLVTEVNE